MGNQLPTLRIERTLNAPLERVWKAWTDANEVAQWWGPSGVTNPTCVWEATPGGSIDIVMLAGPELGPLAGQEWPMTGEFQEVVPMEKLVFTSNVIVDGKVVMQALTTVTLHADGDKTLLTYSDEVTSATPEAEGPLAGMEMGTQQQLDKLSEYVTR